MSYTLINNGDTGASVRTTLNALLTDVNNGVVGATGPAGASGSSGSSGSSGQNGSSGSSGSSGISGIKAPQTLTNAATISWNYANGFNAHIGLTGNSGLSISGATAGDYGTLRITHTNANTVITFGANDKFASATYSFTGATNSVDIYSFYYDGTNYNWNFNLNFS